MSIQILSKSLEDFVHMLSSYPVLNGLQEALIVLRDKYGDIERCQRLYVVLVDKLETRDFYVPIWGECLYELSINEKLDMFCSFYA
jgi:hypothetical protein